MCDVPPTDCGADIPPPSARTTPVRVRSVTVGGCMLVLMSVHISVPVNSDHVLLLCMFQVIPAWQLFLSVSWTLLPLSLLSAASFIYIFIVNIDVIHLSVCVCAYLLVCLYVCVSYIWLCSEIKLIPNELHTVCVSMFSCSFQLSVQSGDHWYWQYYDVGWIYEAFGSK